jgi:hypothetical protein
MPRGHPAAAPELARRGIAACAVRRVTKPFNLTDHPAYAAEKARYTKGRNLQRAKMLVKTFTTDAYLNMMQLLVEMGETVAHALLATQAYTVSRGDEVRGILWRSLRLECREAIGALRRAPGALARRGCRRWAGLRGAAVREGRAQGSLSFRGQNGAGWDGAGRARPTIEGGKC